MFAAIASPWRPRVVIPLLLVFCALFAGPGCDALEGEAILQWADTPTNTEVVIRSALHGGKKRIHMEVTRDGASKRMVLVNDADVRLASLLRYNEWLLVLSGDYVLGGYDFENDRIVPYNSRALPFTVRTRSGDIVQQNRLEEGDGAAPFNFEHRRDPLD